MTDKKNDSSSSEDESVANALREATDHNFFKNSMFDVKKTKRKHDKKERVGEGSESPDKKLKPSLRINPDRDDNFHSFGASQGYKDFVAKKLTEFLDRDIEIEDRINKTTKSSTQKDQDIGVKLLKTSKIFLSCDAEEISQQKPEKIKVKNLEIQEDDIIKCKEAAVDPERILSKSEIKAWNERQKGTVFKYKKMADGTLIEQ